MIGLPATVLGAFGEVLAANQLFVALVPGTVQELRCRPKLTDPAADRLVEEALASLRSSSRGSALRSIPIRRNGDRPPAIVHLIALPEAAGDAFIGASAILIITTVQPRPAPSPQLLQRLFGLSPAEARVASGIAKWKTM
jgi:hypothetical protein